MDLFRRAICERDDDAWTKIVEQYRRMVLGTIRRHPAWRQLHEDDIYWINRSFQRFWTAVGPERFGHFTELPAILSYLKMCAVSVLLDDMRALRRIQLAPVPEATPQGGIEPDHGDVVMDRLDAAALWAAVREALVDDTELLVAQLSFISGASPCEIFERHGDRFGSIQDVYRVKRNMIERLRRKRWLHRYRASRLRPSMGTNARTNEIPDAAVTRRRDLAGSQNVHA
jgi:hypothetical protein